MDEDTIMNDATQMQTETRPSVPHSLYRRICEATTTTRTVFATYWQGNSVMASMMAFASWGGLVHSMVPNIGNTIPELKLGSVAWLQDESLLTKVADEFVHGTVDDGVRALLEGLGYTISHPTPEPPSQSNVDATLLANGFKQKWRGNSIAWLKDGLERYATAYLPKAHYGRMITLLQSSGTGKSRLMSEMAKEYFTLSVCFRDPEEEQFAPENGDEVSPRLGWPPGDSPARGFFVSASAYGDHLGEELAAAFLAALFFVSVKILNESDDYPSFLKHWDIEEPYAPSSSSRHRTFMQVTEKANEILKQNRSVLFSRRKERDPDQKTHANWYATLFRLLIKEQAELLSDLVGKKLNSPFILLVLDECRNLNVSAKRGSQSDMTLLAMQRMIKACESVKMMWTFLLDTTSRIRDVHPKIGSQASSHRLESELRPLLPWPYFVFDAMVVPDPSQTPGEALHLKSLGQYGRPYWSTIPPHRLVDSAISKLLCGPIPDSFSRVESCRNQVFAILSARVLLELGTSEAANMIATEGVQRHMRILIGLVNDNKVLVTRAPSEPMLAIAAAEILLQSTDTYKDVMKEFVDQLILKEDILEKGLKGELLARILLMIARDDAVDNSGTQIYEILTEPNPQPAIRTVTLDQFLVSLLGSELGLGPQDKTCEKLRGWAAPYRLNFTHFLQLDRSVEELSTDFLIQCWKRGVALACVFHQYLFDILLIAYSGDLNQAFDDSKFMVVPVQIKLRATPAHLDLAHSLTSPVILGKDGHRFKPEHLAILMDLGTDKCFSSSQGRFCKLAHEQAHPPKALAQRNKPNWRGYLKTEPLRFCLNIRGFPSRQYPAAARVAPSLAQAWNKFANRAEDIFIADTTVAEMEATLKPLDDYY